MDELKNIKLRKTTTKVGRNGFQQIISSEEEQTKLMDKVSFKKYYPLIKEHTFKSVEFELTDEEIGELISESRKIVKSNYTHVGWKTNETLISLSKKVEEHIHDILKVQYGFIRFNTLSPKDGIFSEPLRLRNLYETALKELDQEQKDSPHPLDFKTRFNLKIYALYIASTNGMRIESGMDAIRLLVHSKRTTHELIKYREGVLETRPHMIVREFSIFDVQYEFRVFIYQGKLCAISQYNPYCYFPLLHKRKPYIQKQLQSFLKEIIFSNEQIMNLQNFIVDLVIVKEKNQNEKEEEEKIKIVELNPYGEFCGSCLYDWAVEKDYNILTGKSNKNKKEKEEEEEEFECEFRILEDVNPLVKFTLEKNWMKILEESEKD